MHQAMAVLRKVTLALHSVLRFFAPDTRGAVPHAVFAVMPMKRGLTG